jgi:hypothetical protein
MTDLDAQLIAAHAAGDKSALIDLYRSAAQAAAGDDERSFFLTHAYICALECAAPETQLLRDQLQQMGRI